MTSSAIIRRFNKISAFVLLAGCLLVIGVNGAAADVSIYSDTLAPGWQNWSWGGSYNLANTSPLHSGAFSISASLNNSWAGLYLHVDNAVDLTGYDMLSFWINGGSSGNQHLDIVANGSTTHYPIIVTANTWTHVNVPLSELGNPGTLSDIYWMDNTGAAQPVFYLDDISLHAIAGPPPPPAAGPALTINAASSLHAISPDIYGMNFADEQLAAELRLPVDRWGGNSTTRYNWQTNMNNTAADWYFENLPAGVPDPMRTLPNGSASDQFVEQDRRTGTKSLITMPLIGWTPKASSPSTHPYDCGFRISKYGAQQSADQWDTNCGNGVRIDGVTYISGNDPNDTSAAINTDFDTAWINHLIRQYGTASNGGVTYYALDNEPMLWDSTHRDVHPNPTTYDELRDRTYLYAPAIKTADPTAKTLGPVLWGWCAYLTSAADNCSQGADFQAHGNTWFAAWYLQQMNVYEQQHGQRILDYLDLHYYPQGNGVSLSASGDPAARALRLRSTRELWDPTYTSESWINDTIQIIPRMHNWISSNYPGTRTAITEYNWGGLEDINGALAQADVLGIFGREGLDLAALWGPPTASQPGAFAFRMYRNYDGAGHGFGDMSIYASSADQGSLAVYGALRSSDNALTLMVINKTAYTTVSTISLSGYTPASSASVYQYSPLNLAAIRHLPDQPVTANGFEGVFPGNSITLFVIPSVGGNVPPTLSIGSPSASVTKSGPVSYIVTYTGAAAVTLANGNVIINKTGTANGTATVSGAGTSTRTITISGITGDGTLGISIAAGTASDLAGNTSAGTGPGTPFTVDNAPPAGSIQINGGVAATKTTAIKLTLTAVDASPGAVKMCISNTYTCSLWVTFAAKKDWTLATGSGTKTVNVWYRDMWGNTTLTPYSASIILDTTAPANGKVTPVAGNTHVTLNWSGFMDTGSGIESYKVVYGTGGAPASCSTGTPIYTGTASTYLHTSLTNGTTYYYRVCAIDKAGNISTGTIASAKPVPETNPPLGTITINSGAFATKSATVKLGLTSNDDSPGAVRMCVSNTTSCTAFSSFTSTKSWTLTTGNGIKTVNVWYRDMWGNTTPTPYSAGITLDTIAPTNGTVTATPGNNQVTLNWAGFTDIGSDIGGYIVRYAQGSAPASCTVGTAAPAYDGTSKTYTHTLITNGTTYGYRVCAIDNAGNISTGATATAKPGP